MDMKTNDEALKGANILANYLCIDENTIKKKEIILPFDEDNPIKETAYLMKRQGKKVHPLNLYVVEAEGFHKIKGRINYGTYYEVWQSFRTKKRNGYSWCSVNLFDLLEKTLEKRFKMDFLEEYLDKIREESIQKIEEGYEERILIWE